VPSRAVAVRPLWVDSVDSVFSRSQYVAAIGHASSREMAERNALAALTGLFGQAIYADQTITNVYREAIRDGITAGWSDDITMYSTIRTTAAMDSLVGAEIRETWHDTRTNTFYAAAVMDRARTAVIYRDMILANQSIINNLTNMNAQERNSLEGFSRYQFAAAVADINITYGNVLSVIGVPSPVDLPRGDTFRLEARNITREIPIGVRVVNDRAGRIQGAFTRALTDLGFRSGGADSRYILDVNINLSPVEFPNNPHVFARMEVDSRLSHNGVTLLPFNFNLREGHTSMPEAENRAFMAAERRINAEYANLLSGYLSQLIPRR
jgi:hypothetical protein